MYVFLSIGEWKRLNISIELYLISRQDGFIFFKKKKTCFEKSTLIERFLLVP